MESLVDKMEKLRTERDKEKRREIIAELSFEERGKLLETFYNMVHGDNEIDWSKY